MSRTIFHLSLPALDLAQTQSFYCSALGATPGRVTPEWIDVILFGHQLTFHQQPAQVRPPEEHGVQHFGAILSWPEWERLCESLQAAGHPLLTAPTVFASGTPAEHGKVLLRDPSGHLLEFKAYRNVAGVVPG